MSFREHLDEVCKVDGAIAACVMGFDGIAIETVTPAETMLDIETLMVEFSQILGQIRSAAQEMKTGDLSELSVGTDLLITHLRPITPDYFLALAMSPQGNQGKGRFLLRVTAPKLKAEL